jgi:hypothetical protein
MILNVRDYLDARLGVHTITRASADGVVLGVAPAVFLRQDPARLSFTFVNLSAQVIWLTPVGVPSAVRGYYLGPNGGALNINAEEDGETVAWGWSGVAAAAGSAYFCLETLIAPRTKGG